MTESVTRIHSIVMKHGTVSRAEWTEATLLPALFRRVRHLLRVYYDVVLHEVGLFLQLNPGRFRACLSSAPEMETFVLDDPIDLGQWRLAAAAIEEAVKADPEADDGDRERMGDLEDKSGKDCAAYQLAFFLGDVLVAFLINPANDEKDKERQRKAMKKLVMMSTIPVYRRAFGDPLTDAMRPIYWTPKVLVKFSHAGGLPALIGDWPWRKLPEQAWARQTAESLLGIMRELIRKIEMDGDEFTETPMFAGIMHQIYSRYGIDPFERASRLSEHEIIFYFLHRRLSKKPEKFQNAGEWLPLLKKYRNVPNATRKRHGWMIHTVSGRWDLLTFYGCKFAGCPERSDLLELKALRVRGQRDPVVEDRLFQWGGASKACTRCKAVSYCGLACQKADWKRHKSECAKEAAGNKNEEI
ncbi:hypothetical protein BU15DRAFT_90206 [Melanogaster broomeanus]|nr:hypothetical protein BU15DRAFT_90206 [Melanogaster broomeanus]